MPYGYPSNYGSGYPSGGASFSPSDIAGLTRWYKADALSLNDNDAVATWTDSSGNVNATQGTGANQPTYKTNIVNGKPIVRFNGTSTRLSIGDLSALTAAEGFIVIKTVADPAAGLSSGGLWEIGTEPFVTHFSFSADGTIYDQFGTNARKTTVNPATSLAAAFNIYSVYSAANDWQSYLNGVSLFSTAVNTAAFTATATLGSDTAATNFLSGDVAEFILYNAKLSAGDRTNVLSYLTSKYGL